jgi:hypothetical protein
MRRVAVLGLLAGSLAFALPTIPSTPAVPNVSAPTTAAVVVPSVPTTYEGAVEAGNSYYNQAQSYQVAAPNYENARAKAVEYKEEAESRVPAASVAEYKAKGEAATAGYRAEVVNYKNKVGSYNVNVATYKNEAYSYREKEEVPEVPTF